MFLISSHFMIMMVPQKFKNIKRHFNLDLTTLTNIATKWLSREFLRQKIYSIKRRIFFQCAKTKIICEKKVKIKHKKTRYISWMPGVTLILYVTLFPITANLTSDRWIGWFMLFGWFGLYFKNLDWVRQTYRTLRQFYGRDNCSFEI